MRNRVPLTRACALLCTSGACALVYQTVWLRSFRLIFGASTPSSAAVVALFLGGLGVGGVVLGRRLERSMKPLRAYGNLELGVAATAAVTPFLLDGVRAAYLAIGGSTTLGSAATVVRLLLAAVVLGAPTILMGGTLPAMARAVTSPDDDARRSLAWLYGMNTAGAVLGCLASTFALLEIYGARATLWIAVLLNALVGLSARSLARGVDDVPVRTEPARTTRASARPMVLGFAFVTGFAFALLELVWYRMSSPILGGSTYSFGLVLACALFGIGVGGTLYAIFPAREATRGRLALTCALEAVLVLVPFALGDELAIAEAALQDALGTTFPGLALAWALVAGLLVVPAAVVAGYQFPLLLAVRGRSDDGVARDVGDVYALNTAGSIAGSLLGGFGLLPLLTAPGAWKLAGIVLVAMGAAFAVVSAPRERRRALSFVVCVLAFAVLLRADGPRNVWRHGGVGVRRAAAVLHATSWNERREAREHGARFIVEERDGLESGVAFSATSGLSVFNNGKSDGNAVLDAQTTVGLSVIPALIHDGPLRRGFVVGLASGESAGWLAALPGIERVDVVEIEPAMTRMAELCAAANEHVLENPRVHLTFGDGREALTTADGLYDVIVSEPSNPFRAGVASFYAREFFETVDRKLAPHGVFSQWLQGYEVDGEVVRTALATISSVFPVVSVWRVRHGDLLLVATREPQVVDVDALDARLHDEPFRTAMGRVFGAWDAEGVLALHLAAPAVVARIAASTTTINTDDQAVLEYMFARTVGRPRTADPFTDLLAVAHPSGGDRPVVRGRAPVWDRVDAQRGRADVLTVEHEVTPRPGAGDDERLLDVWAARTPPLPDGDGGGGDGGGGGDDGEPADPLVRVARAEALAAVSSPATGRTPPGFDDDLARLEHDGLAGEVAWLRLAAALARGDDDVPALAERACAAARADPWIAQPLVNHTLLRLAHFSDDDAGRERVARALLVGPFAAYAHEELRRTAALDVAGATPACADALAVDDPHPRWTRAALSQRALCYERFLPARAAAARDDLARFDDHAQPSLVDLLK